MYMCLLQGTCQNQLALGVCFQNRIAHLDDVDWPVFVRSTDFNHCDVNTQCLRLRYGVCHPLHHLRVHVQEKLRYRVEDGGVQLPEQRKASM